MNMLGYIRVSTDEQASNGYGMASQEQQIREACAKRDWTLLDVLKDEGLSGKSLERPALYDGLERIADGRADGLVVAKLDRLTRSVIDFGLLLEWFTDAQATLAILDPDVDISTANGRLMASIISAMAEWEREIISQRTKDGLAIRQARGLPRNQGSVADDPWLAAQIRDMRENAYSLKRICAELEREGIPTVRGGTKWRPSAVVSVLGYQRKPRRQRVALPKIGRR